MQSQFPSEWCSVACEQIVVDPKADIVDGPFGSNLKSSEYTDSGVPIARIQNVKRFKFIDKNIRFITSTKAEALKRHSFIGGDILITKLGDPLGLACEVPNSFDSGIIVADLVRLRANTSVCSKKFIIYLLNSPVVIAQLEKHIKGSTRPRINLGIVRGLGLPLPPLAEQEEIAHRLETMLAQVEATQARLARISDIIKRFRQSVLSAAVSGKLITVAEHNVVTVGSVTTDIRYGTSKKCNYDGGQTPVIRIPNIGTRKIDLSDLKYADFTEKELETLALKTGDILVIRSNGSLDLVAKPALVDQESEGFLYAGYLIRLRCDDKKIIPSFLLNVMSSRVVRDVVEISARSTSGVNNINSKELASLKFVLPSITEQTEIVRRVEQLFAYADCIELQAKAAKERVDNLTQAILAKAFRGELTADWRAANPDLISGDNSAAALLARIQAERATAKPRKRATKKSAT
jgi:type I restriction enzyme S subunit